MGNDADLIFVKDGIYEVLLGSSGVRTILRPIGIIKRNGKLKARIYRDTTTFKNIQINDRCSINFSSPIDFWYSFKNELKFRLYRDVPVLENFVIVKCHTEDNDTDPVNVNLEVIESNLKRKPVYTIRRGDLLLIDLLVNFSRVSVYSGDELIKLLTIINYEIEVIEKTSPDLAQITSEIRRSIESKGYKLK